MVYKIERVLIQIKAMKMLFFVPIFVYYILFPLCVLGYLSNPIGQMDVINILSDLCYTFVPIVSTWWLFLYLREVVEEAGREIVLLGGGITWGVGIFYVLHAILMLPIFWIFDSNSALPLYLQMLVVTFFMYGSVYILCAVLKNIAITLLLILSYSILATIPSNDFKFWQYGSMNTSDWLSYSIPFLILGGVFWYIAHTKAREM